MSNYEDRIIGLKFDNAQFERRAQQTLNTLDSMSRKIYLLGSRQAASSFDAITGAAKKVSLDPMQQSISKVVASFETLKVRAITSIESIVSSAASAAKSWAKSLSVDQFYSGWSKYEEKTAAIQTMLSAGYDLDSINKNLEKLMWYTDETSYNFTDMANNIGKFTAQGVDLDVATDAMMGISNWAASAGQNATSASMAMYNLSQAIGMGKVTLMDWKSVENANMSTKEFKENVLETAASLGTLKKEADGTFKTLSGAAVDYSNFRNYLSEGFFTTEVLTATLQKYNEYTNKVYEAVNGESAAFETAADAMKYFDEQAAAAGIESATLGEKAFKAAQEAKSLTDAINATKDAVSSTWMRIIERVTGTYYDTKGLWTDFTNFLWDVFAGPLNEIDDYIESWLGASQLDEYGKELKDADGNILTERNRLMDGLLTTMSALSEAFSVVQKAFKSVFPPPAVETLINLVQKFKEWSETLVYLEKPIDENGKRITKYTAKGAKLYDTASKIFTVFKNIGKTIKKVVDISAPFFKSIKKLFETLWDMFLLYNKAKSLATRLPKWMDTLEEKTRNIIGILTKLSDSIRVSLVPALDAIVEGGFKGFLVSAVAILSGIADALLDIFTEVTGIDTEIYKNDVKKWLLTVAAVILNVSKIIKGSLKTALNLGLLILSKLIDKVFTIMTFIAQAAEEWGPSLLPVILAIFNAMKKVGKALEESMPSIIKAVGVLLEALSPVVTKAITIIGNFLAKAIKFLPKLLGYITNAVNYFKEFFKTFDIKEWFGEKKKEVLSFIEEWFGIGQDTVLGFINGIQETIKSTKLYSWVTNMIDTVKNILGIHSPSTVMFAIGAYFMRGFFDGIFKTFPEFKNKVANAFGTFVDFITDNFPLISSLVKAILDPVISITTAILEALKEIDYKKLLNYIGTMLQNLVSIVSSLTTAIKLLLESATKNNAFDKLILLFNDFVDAVISSGILKEVFYSISQGVKIVTTAIDGLITVFKSLISSGVGGSIKDFFSKVGDYISKLLDAYINMINQENGLLNFAKTILVLALAFNIFTMAIVQLRAAGAAKALTKLFKTFEGIADESKKASKGKWYIKLLLLLGVIGYIASQIKDMELGPMIAFFAGLVAVLISMAVATSIMSKVKMDPADANNLRTMIGSLSLLVLALGGALSSLARYSPESIYSSMIALGVALLSLEVAIAGLVAISNIKGFNAVTIKDLIGDMALLGLVMFEISGVLASAVAVAKLAGTVENGGFKKMFATLGGLLIGLIAVGGLSEVMKRLNLESSIGEITGIMIALSACVAVLALSAKLLDKVEWTSLGKLGVLFAGLSVALGGLIALNYWLKTMDTIKIDDIFNLTLILGAMVGLMGALAAIGFTLRFVPWESIGKLGALMGGLLVSFAAMSAILKYVKVGLDTDDTARLVVILAALAGTIAAFAGVSLLLNSVEWQSIGKLGVLITGLEVSFAGLMAILKLVNANSGVQYVDVVYISTLLLGLAGVVATFGAVALGLNFVEWESMGKLGVLLAGLEISFAGLITICNMIKSGSGITNTDVGSLSLLMMSFAGVVAVLAALSTRMEDVKWESLGKVGALYVAVSAIVPLLMLSANILKDEFALKSMITLSAILMSFAGVMAVMALMAMWLDSISWNSLAKTGALYFAVLGIVPLLALSSNILKDPNNIAAIAALKSILLSFIGVVAAMAALSVVMTWVSWESLGKLGSIFAVVAATIPGLALIAKITDSSRLLSTLIPLTAMLTHLVLIVGAIAILAKYLNDVTWTSLLQLGSIMAGLIVSMTAMALLAKLVKKVEWTSIFKMALMLGTLVTSLAVISGVMVVLAKALTIFSQIPWESIGKAAAILGGLVVVLGLLGLVGKTFGTGLVTLSIGVIALSASFLVIALSGLVLASAISTLGSSLVPFMAAVNQVLPDFNENMKGLAEGLGNAFVAFVQVISQNMNAFKDLIVNTLLLVWNAIVDFFKGITDRKEDVTAIFEGLRVMLSSLVTNLIGVAKDTLPEFVDLVLLLIGTLLTKIKEYNILGKLNDLFVQAIGLFNTNLPLMQTTLENLITSLLTVVENTSPKLATTIVTLIKDSLTELVKDENLKDIIKSLNEAVIQIIEGCAEKAGDLVGALADLIIAIVDKLTEKVDPVLTSITNLIVEILDKSGDSLTKVNEALVKFIKKVLSSVATTVGDLTDAVINFICDIITGVAKSIMNNISKVTTALNNLALAIIYALGYVIGNSGKLGGEILKAFFQGILDGLAGAKNILASMIESIMDFIPMLFDINSPSKKMWDYGNMIVQGTKKGIEDNEIEAINALTNMGKEMQQQFRKDVYNMGSPSKEMAKDGNFIVEGLANGINDNAYKAEDAVKELARGTINAFNDEAKIHSPSEEGEDSGENEVDGIILGMKNKEEELDRCARDTADTAIDAVDEEIDENAEETGENLITKIFGFLSSSKVKNENKKSIGETISALFNDAKEYLNSGKLSGSLSNFKDYLGLGDSTGDKKSFTDILSNLFGIDPDSLTLTITGIFDSTELDDALNKYNSDSSSSSSSGSTSSSTPRVSSVLAASTSNAINRNIEAYAAQKDADTATIQKILQGLTSTKPANENTFYITNEDPEAVAYAVANTLQRQSESEELVWA